MNHTTTDDTPTHAVPRASERLSLSARAVDPERRVRAARLSLSIALTFAFVLTTFATLRPNLASAAGYSPGDSIMVSTDALNLRAEPGLGGEVLVVLPYGSPLVLRSGESSVDGYTWYEVESPIDGTEANYILGWVAADFVAPWVPESNVGGNDHYQPGVTVVVNTDALNLRVDAGLGAAVLDVLPGGTYANVLSGPYASDGLLWYRVNSYGTVGFAAAQYLSLATSGGDVPSGSTAIVDTDVLNLRSGPGLANPAIATLSGGTAVTILDGPVAADGYSWYNVDTAAHGSGWVCGECLRTN